jgi:hypothetical protein
MMRGTRFPLAVDTVDVTAGSEARVGGATDGLSSVDTDANMAGWEAGFEIGSVVDAPPQVGFSHVLVRVLNLNDLQLGH